MMARELMLDTRKKRPDMGHKDKTITYVTIDSEHGMPEGLMSSVQEILISLIGSEFDPNVTKDTIERFILSKWLLGYTCTIFDKDNKCTLMIDTGLRFMKFTLEFDEF